MTETFDPYYQWLGIPREEQPPNRYRLLGIKLFESNPDVISNAADQRMVYVRTFHTGEHAKLAQAILNEVSVARVCLLNPEQKVEYDGRLRQQVDSHAPPNQAAPRPPMPGRTKLDSRADADVRQPKTAQFLPMPGPTKLDRKASERFFFRSVTQTVLSVPHLIDGFLKGLAGEKNVILDNFLRCMMVAVAIVGSLAAVVLMSGMPYTDHTLPVAKSGKTDEETQTPSSLRPDETTLPNPGTISSRNTELPKTGKPKLVDSSTATYSFGHKTLKEWDDGTRELEYRTLFDRVVMRTRGDVQGTVEKSVFGENGAVLFRVQRTGGGKVVSSTSDTVGVPSIVWSLLQEAGAGQRLRLRNVSGVPIDVTLQVNLLDENGRTVISEEARSIECPARSAVDRYMFFRKEDLSNAASIDVAIKTVALVVADMDCIWIDVTEFFQIERGSLGSAGSTGF